MSTDREEDGKVRVIMTRGEFIAGIALIITVVSGLNGWLVLPERMNQQADLNNKQSTDIAAMQLNLASKGEQIATTAVLVQGINERTKRIEDALQRGH